MEKLKSIYKERKKEVVIGAAIVLEILIVVLTIWALGNMKTPSNEGKQPVVVVQNQKDDEDEMTDTDDKESLNNTDNGEKQDNQVNKDNQESQDAQGNKDNQESQDTQGNKDNQENQVAQGNEDKQESQDTQGDKDNQQNQNNANKNDSQNATGNEGEVDKPTTVTQHVDFLVEVESGRDPVVLQLTDPQIIDSGQERYAERLNSIQGAYWATDKIEERCYSYIRETIQGTKPDLILITGDIVYGEFDDNGTALQSFVKFMDSFGIPWAPVFGNHENESAKGVDWQCDQFEKAKYCLFKQRELTGNGNYTVGIMQGGELKRVFFMLDSNGCSAASSQSLANGHTVTTTGFGQDQIKWYTETAKKITSASPKTKLTFAFHIQLAVFKDAYVKYGFDNSTTKENPINIYEQANKGAQDFGYLGRVMKTPWDDNYSVWKGLKALGVDSILVGHEHCNSASVIYQGVRFQYGQKISTYDRASFLKTDGTIVGVACGDMDGSSIPLMGGTVMPLSAKDGTIKNPYIFLCGGMSY